MPDILSVFSKWWKTILGFVIVCSLVALAGCLLSTKKYLSTATALPANSALSDRARLFNENIQLLYSELGDPNELDRIEGTAELDTIYIATAEAYRLASHYGLGSYAGVQFDAADKLKKNTRINRSAYGELKIRVWDKDPQMAAVLANELLSRLQQLHQNIMAQGNAFILEELRKKLATTQQHYILLNGDSSRANGEQQPEISKIKEEALLEQLKEQEKLVAEYELASTLNPQVLIPVERARPSYDADKPRTVQTVLLTAFTSFVFIFLLLVFQENRKRIQ